MTVLVEIFDPSRAPFPSAAGWEDFLEECDSFEECLAGADPFCDTERVTVAYFGARTSSLVTLEVAREILEIVGDRVEGIR